MVVSVLLGERPPHRGPAPCPAPRSRAIAPPPVDAAPGPSRAKEVAPRAEPGPRVTGRRVILSRDRRIITRKRNKLTIAAVAGTLTVATAAPAAAAASGSPQSIAKSMLASFGWSSSQFSCLEPLWAHESGWNTTATNPSTGAYGIPQAVPGSKMASAGPNWKSDAATQIKWGLTYIKDTYKSPCGAWSHEQADGWY